MTIRERLASTFDVFSRRESPRHHPPGDISERLRTRILILYRDVVSGPGPWSSTESRYDTYDFWGQMHNKLQHLYGQPWLTNHHGPSPIQDAEAFLITCSVSQFFDFIELSFKLDVSSRVFDVENDMVEAINAIFHLESAPYRLTEMVKVREPVEGGRGVWIRTTAYPQVIRFEDEVVHAEAVVPALSVLSAPHFEAANTEFRDAMEEYRKQNYGDCLTKCGSAFESTLKVLCERNGWTFDPNDTTGKLLKVVIESSALESFFEQPLMLVATIRNRLSSSHGGGSQVRAPSRQIARYSLTSTAAGIVLLVETADVNHV